MTNALLDIVTIDFYDCNRDILKDREIIRKFMLAAAGRMKVEIVADCFNTFTPWGVSGTVTIAESHLAIHTWPEYDFAAVTFETCGHNVDHRAGIRFIEEKIEAKSKVVKHEKRGFIAAMEKGAYKQASKFNH